jgi:AcrR family transcriptional regulator
MARPRTVSDEAILDAANDVMQRLGPEAVTFAAVGARAGLSPATLVQRYGSKDALVRAALLRAWDQLDALTEAGDIAASLDSDGAVELLVGLSDYGDHDQFAEGLLLLREDMRDPLLRARGERWGMALALALGRRLTPDPARQLLLGRLMASQWQGSLLWWGFSRHGSVADFVAAELRAWLETIEPKTR